MEAIVMNDIKILRKSNEKYGLQKVGKNVRIVKVLKEYTDEKEAIDDLAKLSLGEIKEEDLLDADSCNNDDE